MAGTDPFAGIPRTTRDLIKNINPDSPELAIELNRVQSAHIGELLRQGKVTPAQVTAWRTGTDTMPDVLPNTVAVPAIDVGLGGRTAAENGRFRKVLIPSHETTQEQRDEMTSRTGTSDGQVAAVAPPMQNV